MLKVLFHIYRKILKFILSRLWFVSVHVLIYSMLHLSMLFFRSKNMKYKITLIAKFQNYSSTFAVSVPVIVVPAVFGFLCLILSFKQQYIFLSTHKNMRYVFNT